MSLFKKPDTGISENRDSKLTEGFIKKCALIILFGVMGGPLIIYYFMFPDSYELKYLLSNLKKIQWDRFFTFYVLVIIASLILVLLSLNTYYREKGSKRGKEHGSSKFMTPKDMPKFRRDFFYNPDLIRHCKGFEKTAKNTFYDTLGLKRVIRNTNKLEWEYRKNPLKPLKGEFERKKHINSPSYRCFINSQILGQDVYISMNCKYINRNLNTITIGGSGQGKSFSELFPNILNANANYVITDPSGEILTKCGKFLRSQGYALKVFNVKDFMYSMRYNPLRYVEDEKDINVLVDAINKNIAGNDIVQASVNKFFDDAQKALTAALISAMLEIYPNNKEKHTFYNMMEFFRLAYQATDPITGLQKSDLDKVFNNLKIKDPRSYAVKMYENFKVAGPKLCGEVIISGTAVFGRYFDSNDIAKLIEEDDLDLYDFVTGVDEDGMPLKCALFLIIPQDNSSYNFMVSMIYSQLFSIATKGGEKWRLMHNTENPALPRHLSFWLDEFANIGKIPSFNEILSVVRKYNISINIIIQALSQLKAGYKDSWGTIIGNCDTTVYLGGQEPSSIKTVMEKLGKETIKTHSISQSKKGGTTMSSQVTGSNLLTESEIEQLERAYELLFITGLKPFKVRKYNLTQHPNYTFFGEADPDNNLKITTFKNEADKGMSHKEYKITHKWKKTGKKDKSGVDIMKLTREKEELLDSDDRLVRIDENTIFLDGILKAIDELEDKTYSLEKKVRMLKQQWKSAENERRNKDQILIKLKEEMNEQSPYITKEDIADADDEFQESCREVLKKHVMYLEYRVKELEKTCTLYKEKSEKYKDIKKQIVDAKDTIEKDKKRLKELNEGAKESPKTKIRITKKTITENSMKAEKTLNENKINTAEKLNEANTPKDLEDVTKEMTVKGRLVISVNDTFINVLQDT